MHATCVDAYSVRQIQTYRCIWWESSSSNQFDRVQSRWKPGLSLTMTSRPVILSRPPDCRTGCGSWPLRPDHLHERRRTRSTPTATGLLATKRASSASTVRLAAVRCHSWRRLGEQSRSRWSWIVVLVTPRVATASGAIRIRTRMWQYWQGSRRTWQRPSAVVLQLGNCGSELDVLENVLRNILITE